jgi:hypothetical protein
VEALLRDRKYVFLNSYSITEQGLSFIEEGTTSFCILPLRIAGYLRGYFFMEGNEQTGPLVHHDDALLFIIDTVSYILTKKETG